ncbi:LysR family transcriptional regulator [Nocardia sp. NPDC004604]|uniref:LysR family transcriptional regulator n=1 Tax=Nocardia sp. NPDC004604 TaxID=3157013 RepID=UPI0033B5887F
MELAQLRSFLAVVDEEGFTRAAAAQHLTQPAVSLHISRLEHELGQRLFDRTGRRVTLTDFGQLVLGDARLAVAATSKMQSMADEVNGLLRGRLRLGSVASVDFDLIGLVASFHERHPAIELSLVEDRSERLTELLLTNRLDAAVVASCHESVDRLDGILIANEPLVAIAAPSYGQWPSCRMLTLHDLVDRPVATLPIGTGTRAALDHACHQEGIALDIRFEANTPATLRNLARAGLGIAILPEPVARTPGVRAHPIGPVAIRTRLSILWAGDQPPSSIGRAFTRHVSDRLARDA